MFDIRLAVFHAVALRLSFSRAAGELHITQPAVTRHIQQLEQHFKQKLFHRKGNSIALTEAGNVLLRHCNVLFGHYADLEYDMESLLDKKAGNLRIAASTTIAQYILPEMLPDFHSKFSDVRISMSSQNTEEVERSVLEGSVELGFIEGRTKNREIVYGPFLKDEIVLVVAKHNPLFKRASITLEELVRLPILLREQGSGTLQVILSALAQKGIQLEDLQVEMHLGSSESIKSYLRNSNSMAFLSISTILRELKLGEFFVVDVEQLQINRDFYHITTQGPSSPITSLLISFLEHRYNNRL
ncbi:MAG: LysR family transcriptional regulator [Sediminicola sp.]